MKIHAIKNSVKNNKLIISGNLTFDSGKSHNVYFETDKKNKGIVAKDASAFLIAALPIAMKKKEDIEIDGRVCARLMQNLPEIMRIIESWDIGLAKVSVFPKGEVSDKTKSNDVACFFSGGADSFYTYMKNKKKINHFVFAHGFDIPADDYRLYRKVEKNISKIAKEEKVKLIKIRTNLRTVYEWYFDWNMSNVYALASSTLLFRKGFAEIFMSCGQTGKNAIHRYMVPELDILWSTENMKVNHYGCHADKITKLKFISKFKIAMDNLRVCWLNKHKEYNCCECEKCFRNMLALYATGSLSKCNTFKKKINVDRLKNIRVDGYVLQYFISALDVMNKRKQRSEIRDALKLCIKNNQSPSLSRRLYRDFRAFIRHLDKAYNRNRLFWFLAQRGYIA